MNIGKRSKVNAYLYCHLYSSKVRADFKIGFVYFARNEFHQAKNYYQQAYERFNRLNPTLPTTTAAQYRLARIQMIEGNYSDAM